MPKKIELNKQYINTKNLIVDLKIIFRTLITIIK